MKKLVVFTILIIGLITSCNDNKTVESLTDERSKTQYAIKQKKSKEEISLTQKVAATFNKMIQKEQVFKSVINSVTEDHVMLKNEYTSEDHFIVSALTIRDDLIMSSNNFENIFMEIYTNLYPEEYFSYDIMLKKLPKLHFGVPVSALENYSSWKERGFPIFIKSYNSNDNKLEKITKEKVIEGIGKENYEKLVSLSQETPNNFYAIQKNKALSIISAKGNKGSIIKIKEEEVKLASFQINSKDDFNNIIINENNKSYKLVQNNMFYQSYFDIGPPNPCNNFYVFECGSIELENHITKQLKLANDTCTIGGECLPICCDGSIIWVAYQYKPTSIKCAVAMNYANELSMYSLLTPN